MILTSHRLRKHADYQRVYRAGRKQFARNIAYFYALRSQVSGLQVSGLQVSGSQVSGSRASCATDGPRVGLTAPKALGNAVVRNRIKRRMREAVRHSLPLLSAPVDVVLHPRGVVAGMEFAQLEREVANLFRSVQAACDRVAAKQSSTRDCAAAQTSGEATAS